jgi:hypothetical protein
MATIMSPMISFKFLIESLLYLLYFAIELIFMIKIKVCCHDPHSHHKNLITDIGIGS